MAKHVKKKYKASLPIRIIKNLFSICLALEIAVMAVFVGLLVAPTFVGVQPYSILTASMTPTIPAGSLVYVNQSLDIEQFRPNDVIAFTEEGANFPIVHRVQSVGDGYYITKGDANSASETIPFSQVLGKEIYHIPHLGNILSWALQYKMLFVCIVLGTAALVFIFSSIAGRQADKKRRADLAETVEEQIHEEAQRLAKEMLAETSNVEQVNQASEEAEQD